MTIPGLKQICEVLDIERSGTKRSIMERIMEFLLKPTSSGLKVPQKKKGKLLIIMCCVRVRHTEDISGEWELQFVKFCFSWRSAGFQTQCQSATVNPECAYSYTTVFSVSSMNFTSWSYVVIRIWMTQGAVIVQTNLPPPCLACFSAQFSHKIWQGAWLEFVTKDLNKPCYQFHLWYMAFSLQILLTLHYQLWCFRVCFNQ